MTRSATCCITEKKKKIAQRPGIASFLLHVEKYQPCRRSNEEISSHFLSPLHQQGNVHEWICKSVAVSWDSAQFGSLRMLGNLGEMGSCMIHYPTPHHHHPAFRCHTSEVSIFNSLFCRAVVSLDLFFHADYTQDGIIHWVLSLAQCSGMQFDILVWHARGSLI